MKRQNIFIIMISFFVLISCDRKREKTVQKKLPIVYNIDVYRNLKNKNVTIIDTSCINGTKRAKQDIKNGKLSYLYYPPMFRSFRGEEEFKNILKENNIKIIMGFSSCIHLGTPKGFKENCYEKIMAKEIENKFGTNFIDSLKIVAEKRYIIKNPETIYTYEECDTISRYPNTKNYSDFFEKPTRDFDSLYPYPKNYDHKAEKLFSTTVINFILLKNGKIKNVVAETDFINPNNRRFISSFQKKAIEFVKNTKWIPSKKQGINVNSEMRIILEHK
ncbi:hypothetical protein [Flavobacterium pedocola]